MKMWRAGSAIALAMAWHADPAFSATCVWNASGGEWHLAANWTGCSDGGGASTRPPGASDIAVLANGSAFLVTDVVVAELELGTNAVLAVSGGSGLREVRVQQALRLAGGRTSATTGIHQLRLVLAAEAMGTLLADSALEGATFLENLGSLELGSDSGIGLTLRDASEIRNLAGGVIELSGSASRILLDGSARLTNSSGASLTVEGNARIGHVPVPATVLTTEIHNFGNMHVIGPGLLDLALGNPTRFLQSGTLLVQDATLWCDETRIGDACRFTPQAGEAADAPSSITVLDAAVLALGGAEADLPLDRKVIIAGHGTIQASVIGTGDTVDDVILAPGALTGPPYGTLSISGDLRPGVGATLEFDLGGGGDAMHDHLVVGGQLRIGGTGDEHGEARLRLRLAPTYQPAPDQPVGIVEFAALGSPVSSFAAVEVSPVAIPYVSRFDPSRLVVFPGPQLSLDDAHITEGHDGVRSLSLFARLSRASSLPVSFEWYATDGTAFLPDDYVPASASLVQFAPGQTQQVLSFSVNGDVLAEASEAFGVVVERRRVSNATMGNDWHGNLPAAAASILDDDSGEQSRVLLVTKGVHGLARYTASGVLLDRFPEGQPGNTTGLCLAPGGDVLVMKGTGAARLYSRHGAERVREFGARPQAFPNGSNRNACGYDAKGDVYLGIAAGSQPLLYRFNRIGNLQQRFSPPVGASGLGGVEVSGDGCTLYYTTQDTTVRRFDVCQNVPLPDFATGLTAPACHSLRVRLNGEVMVTCRDAVHRLDAQGGVLRTYTRQSLGENDANGLQALSLDPDGSSFWTAGVGSGVVRRVDIDSGAVLASFGTESAGPGGVRSLAALDGAVPATPALFADGFE